MNLELSKAKKRISYLQKKLSSLGPVMRGSIVLIGTKNKQLYFSVNKNNKTSLIYLGKNREGLAREYSKNYKKLLEIVEEMTELNMFVLKSIEKKLKK